jgi:hypothetical protein
LRRKRECNDRNADGYRLSISLIAWYRPLDARIPHLDRLARSMKQLIETIEALRVRGIGFRSLTEALDTTTAQERLVFHMFGALAEFEHV